MLESFLIALQLELLFVSPRNIITNSSGEFGLDETSTECEVFLKRTEAVARRCSAKKDVLRNFTKFTGKHLCQSPIFNKVAAEHLVAASERNNFIQSNAAKNKKKFL